MRILLTNDDGVDSLGIKVLYRILSKKYDVVLIAPDRERSGQSQSITIGKEIVISSKSLECKIFSCTGTPADCVKIGLEKYGIFDYVISGINNGENLGTDVFYSGTVGAAMEGALAGTPALSISCSKMAFEIFDTETLQMLENIINQLLELKLPSTVNINVPMQDRRWNGLKVCKLGKKSYPNAVKELSYESGCTTYIVSGEPEYYLEDKDTDVYLYSKGFITLTPLSLDRGCNENELYRVLEESICPKIYTTKR